MRIKKAEITALIQQKGGKPGKSEMIGNYQWAIGQVMGKMTEEELDKAKLEAEKNSLMARYSTAARKGKQYACKFASMMWKQCRIHNFNTELDGGRSFNSLQDIQKDWNLYIQESFGDKPTVEVDSNDQAPQAGLPKSKARQDPVKLVTGRITCGIGNATVPWDKVSKDQDQYIVPVYLPPRFKFTDPLKMHKREAITLLEFWRARQDKDKWSVFAFRWWRGSDRTLQEPVEIDSADNVQWVPMKKVKSRQRAVVAEKDQTSMAQGATNDSEDSDWPIEWLESDRGCSGQRDKGKAKRVREIMNYSKDKLPANQESPERMADGWAREQVGKPDRQAAGRPESSKARTCPKPILKGKAAKSMNDKGSSSSKRARAPSAELEEAAPAKKVWQDFSERCQSAATPFPEANNGPSGEETRRSTHKRKAPLPADFGVSPRINGGASSQSTVHNAWGIMVGIDARYEPMHRTPAEGQGCTGHIADRGCIADRSPELHCDVQSDLLNSIWEMPSAGVCLRRCVDLPGNFRAHSSSSRQAQISSLIIGQQRLIPENCSQPGTGRMKTSMVAGGNGGDGVLAGDCMGCSACINGTFVLSVGGFLEALDSMPQIGCGDDDKEMELDAAMDNTLSSKTGMAGELAVAPTASSACKV
ncbi:hypothetical protein BDN67DRAFT_984041 [Paxillus ammoniavirescens]|nr:hypothetical protein BDN67DRAFT_984041 [Paxillus ammoniavirescens]